jgi:hypothetical protein
MEMGEARIAINWLALFCFTFRMGQTDAIAPINDMGWSCLLIFLLSAIYGYMYRPGREDTTSRIIRAIDTAEGLLLLAETAIYAASYGSIISDRERNGLFLAISAVGLALFNLRPYARETTPVRHAIAARQQEAHHPGLQAP